MRVPSYCFKSLESIYYFRMRVPKELQAKRNKVELKKSLRTRDGKVAARFCWQHVQAAEKVFEDLRLKLFRHELLSGNKILKDVVLLKAGLVEFAQSKSGQKLFDDKRPYKGKYGHQVSKDFAKYGKS